jgi:hypothetical protein
MSTEPDKPDYLLIDINNTDELTYIAVKLGCTVEDIHLAVETLKTYKRAEVYSWLIDKIFRESVK